MESIINLYKQQYDMVYENRLKRRKEQMKFNIRDIKEHQMQYMKLVPRRGSFRVKTEISDRHEEQDKFPSERKDRFSPKGCREDTKHQRIIELMKKRKEYG